MKKAVAAPSCGDPRVDRLVDFLARDVLQGGENAGAFFETHPDEFTFNEVTYNLGQLVRARLLFAAGLEGSGKDLKPSQRNLGGAQKESINNIVMDDFGYSKQMRVLERTGLYKSEMLDGGMAVPPPSESQAIDILQRNLTREQFKILSSRDGLSFQLIPITGARRFVDAFSTFTYTNRQFTILETPGVMDCLDEMDRREGITDQNRVTGWRVALTDGSGGQGIFSGDSINKKTMEERLTWFDWKFGLQGIEGICPKRYMLLYLAALEHLADDQGAIPIGFRTPEVIKAFHDWDILLNASSFDGGRTYIAAKARSPVFPHLLELKDRLSEGFYGGFRISKMFDVPKGVSS